MHSARATRYAKTANNLRSALDRGDVRRGAGAEIDHVLRRARFPVARPTTDGRRQASRRRLLVTRWRASRVSKRARAGQPLLSNLYTRPRDGRHQADLSWNGQDDVRVLQAPLG